MPLSGPLGCFRTPHARTTFPSLDSGTALVALVGKLMVLGPSDVRMVDTLNARFGGIVFGTTAPPRAWQLHARCLSGRHTSEWDELSSV